MTIDWLVHGAVILAWVFCGYIHYGWDLAFNQKEFPSIAEEHYEADKRRALIRSLWGPVSLLTDVICGWHKHGRMYRREEPKE